MSAESSESPTRTSPGTPPADNPSTHALQPSGSDSSVADPPGPPAERYELLSFLARGGMGEVWVAHDRVLNRDVALKLLGTGSGNRAVSTSRFFDEARITARLQHPGIPPIHDLGTLPNGRPFIAMKLIRGRTLADVLAEGRPADPRLLGVFGEVCQAVAYAHNRRVIHRDLKPANVMVGAFGEVQVMDWGLAKVLGEAPPPVADDRPPADQPTAAPVSVIESDRDPGSATRAGSLLGTPAYMSPEQAKGEINQTDTRSDVFTLGAMLCELLTGRPPYWAKTGQEVLALAITAQLGPALERLDAAGADPELVALAKSCLRPDPDARPADAMQVSSAMAAFRAGVEARLHAAERDRAAAEARLIEQRKRRRVQLALAAAAAVILAGAAGGLWWADKHAADRDRVRRDAQAEVDRVEARRAADARQQQAEADARAARTAQAVEFLLGEVNTALAADDADRAAVPLGLIEKRLADEPLPAAAAAVARARADLAMLRELDRADDLMWAAEDWILRRSRSTAVWAAAFREYGIDPGKTPTDAATAVINRSVIRDRVLLGLDLWILYGSENGLKIDLRDILAVADPDPYRDLFRNAAVFFDLRFRQALLEDPDVARQPPRFVAVLGQVYQFGAADRERVVRPALDRTPNNVPLIHTMLGILQGGSPGRPEAHAQLLRWAQAAVSVRPGSKVAWRSLGRAHWDRGQFDDSARCYKRAVRLDPRDYNSWTQLSAILLQKHDPEAALEAADRALALNPDYPLAHNNRGAVFQRLWRYAEALREFDLAIEAESRTGGESAHTHNNRGYTRMRLGDYDGAIADFRVALRIDPYHAQADANQTVAIRWRRGEGTAPQPAPPPREVRP